MSDNIIFAAGCRASERRCDGMQAAGALKDTMIFPSLKEFRQLARQGNLVPVWTTIAADLLTPVSAYLNLIRNMEKKRGARRCFSFLLESVEGGQNVARYTYIGADPFLIVRFRMAPQARRHASPTVSGHGIAEITDLSARTASARTRREEGDIAAIARGLIEKFRPVRIETLPPFSAGAVGYMAYDLISMREPVPLPPARGSLSQLSGMPDAILAFYTTLLVFDHATHRIVIIRNVRCEAAMREHDLFGAYEKAVRDIRVIEKKLNSSLALVEENAPGPANSLQRGGAVQPRFRSNVTRAQFVDKVSQAKRHIRAGDVFQVVLSQRLEAKVQAPPFEIYRALRQINPAPYLFFLRFGEDCILGSSPEMLVEINGRKVDYRPIAGTRPRGKDPEEDRRLELEMQADEKECAEHVMLVDLGRNDVGRVSEFGSVEVSGFKFVERYSHVMHLVSSIQGRLRPEFDSWDTLWACFPAGTVTGAPKIRAMQIISDLEPTRRGVYAGAVLYADFSGNLDSCIAIRTMVITGGKAYVQAGAGIVADSVPQREYEETLNKGRALLKAVEMAHERLAGLQPRAKSKPKSKRRHA